MALDATNVDIYVKNAEDPILESFLNAVDFSIYGTVVTGITQDQQIVYIGNLPNMLEQDGGCGTGNPVSATATQKQWNPRPFRGDVEQCESDLRGVALFRQANAAAANRPDLTRNDVFFSVITQLLSDRTAFDAHKLAWFSDTAVTSPPLTSPALVPKYNIIDGLWKKFGDAVTAGDMVRITIAANAEATKAAQLANLTAADAYAALESLVDSADPRLFARGLTPVIVLTRTMHNAIKKYIPAQSSVLEFGRLTRNADGSLFYDGIPLIAEPAWDSIIASDFVTDKGLPTEVLDRPHRMVLTVKENIQLGLGSGDDIMILKQGYDPREEVYYGKVKGWIDAEYNFDYLTVVAY